MHRYVADRPERVVEQANGVDVNRFHPGLDGARVRAHIGVSDRVVVVGYLGAMDRAHAFKGVPTLLDALAAVQEPVHLLAVGGGDLQPEYCGRARKLGLQTSWTGSVSAEELPSHIAAMDLLVLPSVGFGAESFGIVLIEAMAAGKPVIATSLPGVRRVVDDGQNGLLVPPDDASALAAAITRLAADSELRRRLGTAGRAKVEARYDWRELAAQLEAHYRDVLAESID
jgi:phosphatidylinositol alpha-1,6-mannosyltransferase